MKDRTKQIIETIEEVRATQSTSVDKLGDDVFVAIYPSDMFKHQLPESAPRWLTENVVKHLEKDK
jgi:hypothetical protein